MKVWRLDRTYFVDPWGDSDPAYCEMHWCVVIADTEQEARVYAEMESGGKYRGSGWLSPDFATCVEVTANGVVGRYVYEE